MYRKRALKVREGERKRESSWRRGDPGQVEFTPLPSRFSSEAVELGIYTVNTIISLSRSFSFSLCLSVSQKHTPDTVLRINR